MAMTYLQQYDFQKREQHFWERAFVAVQTVAAAIAADANETAPRKAWAELALTATDTQVDRMRSRICQHWLVQANGNNVIDETVGETPGLRQVIESLVDSFV